MRYFLVSLILSLALLIPFALANAAPVSWDFNAGTQILQPLQSGWSAVVKGSYFQATSTTASIFPAANITRLSNLTSNGFVKTSGGDGTLSVDTGTYPTGSGTLGQVAYWSPTNVLTGNNNLFWDSASNYLGVGINTPVTSLHASTTLTAGSATASTTLRLTGALNSGAWTVGQVIGGVEFYNTDASGSGAGVRGFMRSYALNAGGSNWAIGIGNSTSNAAPTEKLTILNTGATAIGSTTPNHFFTVVGGSAASSAATFPISMGADPSASNTGFGLGIFNGLTGGLAGLQGYIRTTGLATGYVLQPYGGNVGIGIQSTPQQALTIGSQITSTARSLVLTVTTIGAPTVTPSASGGSMADGTYYYVITAVTGNGGTTERGTESAAATVSGGGGSGSVALSWSAPAGGGADSYNIYRTTTSGTYGATTFITNTTATSYTDTANAPTSGTPATFATAYLAKIAASGNSWLNGGNLGIGTTTPQWLLNPMSSSASQLSLSAGAGIGQWAFRNAGGNFYLSTTTVAGTATTSVSALSILGSSGNIGIATSAPGHLLDVFSIGTSTLRIDSNSTTRGSCLILKDSDGVGYTYVTANDGVLTASTVACN